MASNFLEALVEEQRLTDTGTPEGHHRGLVFHFLHVR